MADPWVAPDSQPASVVGPSLTAPAPAVVSTGAPTSGLDALVPVPVPLRPLTIPDVLDGALKVWKLSPRTVVGLAAVFVVPAQVLLGILTRNDVEDVRLGQTFGDLVTAAGPDDVETGFGGAAFVVAIVAQGVALAFVTAGVASLVTGWYVGRTAAAGELVVGALRRWWPLLAAWVLVHVVEGLFAIGGFVPAIVPMTWFAVTSAVVACEGIGPVKAMRRSAALCNRRFGAVLGTCLLVVLVDLVLSSALTALGALYLELDLPAGWIVNTVVAVAALLVTMPFVAGVATLLYLDLRVRTEGLDIELAAARRLPR